jgi:tetratricopeptide (TPR) repeat protein
MTARVAGLCFRICFALIVGVIGAEGAEGPEWQTIFEERFTDNPNDRFKIMPVPIPGATSSGGTAHYDEAERRYHLGGHLSVVRPIRAGAHVELVVELQFNAPSEEAPADLQTELMLVLLDESLAGIQVRRPQATNAHAIVQWVHQTKREVKVLGQNVIPPALLDATWKLRYRHGLLTLTHHGNVLGHADLRQLGIPVIGVSWIQKGGRSTCSLMTLKGEPFPSLTESKTETLREASLLNEEAHRLWKDKRPEEALVKMEKASALFVQTHGEEHHDSANSFANLASICGAAGKREEAGKYWIKALALHEAALGPNHPHTALTRFNLGKHYFAGNEIEKAKELWAHCREDWSAAWGPDAPLVQSLNKTIAGSH